MTDSSVSSCVWMVFCFCLAGISVSTPAPPPPTLQCPHLVDEGDNLECKCRAPLLTGLMPGVVTWPGHSNTSTLTLHAVSRRDNGKTFECQVLMMSQISTITYTLQVAYGPADSTVHIYGPPVFATNGSMVLNLSCQATEVNPIPTITWQFEPCNHGSQNAICSFTPQPLEHDNQTISCRATNLVTRAKVWYGSANYTLRLQYPPRYSPSINGHTDRQIHKPGDKMTCTVTGGKPLVSRVIFNCTNPYHKDQEDEINIDKRSSSLVVKPSDQQDFETVCTCQAIWEPKPSLYLSKTSISFAISPEFSQEYVTSRCETSVVYIDESASVTCYFSANLQISGKSFQLYRYKFDSGSTGSHHEVTYEIVLDCYWLNTGDLECAQVPSGYEFNGLATNTLTVIISKVSLGFIGRYECRAHPSYPLGIKHCYVLPKDKPVVPQPTTTDSTADKPVVPQPTTTDRTPENTEEAKGGSSKTAEIVVGVIVAVLVLVGGIVLFLLWKRQIIRLSCFKARPHDQNSSDVENPDPTTTRLLSLDPPNETKTRDHQQSSGNDSGENAALKEDALKSTMTQENVCVSGNMHETRPTIFVEMTGEALAVQHDNGEYKTRPEHLQGPTEVVPRGPGEKQEVQADVRAPSLGETTINAAEQKQQSATQNQDKQDPVMPTGVDHQTADTSQRGPDNIVQEAAAGDVSVQHDLGGKGKDETAVAQSRKSESKDRADNIPVILRSAQHARLQHHSWTRYDTANLQFYQNVRACLPDGELIDDIHSQWQQDLYLLEKKPNCVQWLFPNSAVPEQNEYAQQLNPREAKAIQDDKRAFGRFLRSYRLMLNSYGLKLVDENTGEVQSTTDCAQRFKYLQQTHNYMRITRVLHCLGEIGLERYKKPLIEHILMEAWEGSLRNALRSCRDYWIPTIVNAQELKHLRKLYKNASSCKSVYVRRC